MEPIGSFKTRKLRDIAESHMLRCVQYELECNSIGDSFAAQRRFCSWA